MGRGLQVRYRSDGMGLQVCASIREPSMVKREDSSTPKTVVLDRQDLIWMVLGSPLTILGCLFVFQQDPS